MPKYLVTKNGETVIITESYKSAAAAYNEAIYHGKSGDFIQAHYKKHPNDKWEPFRKDWL